MSRRRLPIVAAVAAVALAALGLAALLTDLGTLHTAGAAPPVTVVGPAADRDDRRIGPCPDIEVRPAPDGAPGTEQVTGGCELSASGERVDLYYLTVVQDVPFGRCSASFRMRVDSEGRVALTDYQTGGPFPCFDVKACHRIGRQPPPLAGRFVDLNGRLELQVDMCLDTCMGRFEGMTAFSVRRNGDSWRLRATDETVGSSGWRLNGGLTMVGSGVDLRPAEG